MAREGKLVIRPDSGDPVDILCGDPRWAKGTPQHKGVIELLWDLFGGTVNADSYRVLDSHIGAIYGDSINEQRAREICERLKRKGFASTNVVFGIGSYTYQYVTRDTHGFAIKATWAQVNGEQRFLSKNPVTDTGEKKSARGRIIVLRAEDGTLQMTDQLTQGQQNSYGRENLYKTVWVDGHFVRRTTLSDVRKLVQA
jgi:nicotinamide phosphoribosyltransferase